MSTTPSDPYAALRFPSYRNFMVGRSFYVLASQMQTVAVSWQIFQRLHSTPAQAALALGTIGLVQVVPMLLFALPSGHLADRRDRRTIVIATQALFALCSLALLFLSRVGAPVSAFYVVLFLVATGRAFTVSASSALYANLVPHQVLPNASAWNSSIFQLAAMIGPAVGGGIVAGFGPETCYLVDALFSVLAIFCFTWTRPLAQAGAAPVGRTPMTLDSVLSGVRFVFGTRLLLAMFCLDLFAVLLAGATALLPIFADDILKVGATGFGWLRAAPSIGAIAMALLTAHLPPWRKAGLVLLWAVAGYSVAMVVFGFSKSFWLSMLALGLSGMFDNISVIVRSTVAQMITPDAMRGRVAAITFTFISCSNELGEFESGVTASWFGPVGSVVIGGLGSLLVVIGSIFVFPELKQLGLMHELKPIGIREATDEELAEKGA
jgi:MFS family permease